MDRLLLRTKKKNYTTFKPLIAAEYSGLKIRVEIDSELHISYWEEPVLETLAGTICESNTIARYVTRLKPDSHLYGSSVYDYGCIEQWIEFSSMRIDANIVACCPTGTGCAVLLSGEEAAITALKRALGALNMHLASNTYLVGLSVTLADIVLTCDLYLGFTQLMPKSFTCEFPHVERYFWTLVNEPNFKKILGEVKQSESVPPEPKPEASEEGEAPKAQN